MTSRDTSPSRQSGKKSLLPSTSLFIKYSAMIVSLILLIFSTLTLLSIKNQKDILYQEKVNAGEMLLSQLANRAVLPLIENDMLNLHSLIKEMKGVKEVVYVAIVDDKKIIRAHTDSARVGSPLESSSETLSSGRQGSSLTKPMTFMNQNVGSVVLGVSIDSIDHEMKKERLSLIKKNSIFCFVALLMGVGVAFLFTRWAQQDLPLPFGSETLGKPAPLHPADFSVNRTQATILSAGIKDFKAYSGAMDPKALLNDLNQFFSIATDGILEHGGYVDKISGDVVIGVFKSSPFQKNPTIRAIRCAISIKKTLEQASTQGNPLLSRAGFGISSGVVLSGPLLSQDGRETTFIGESFKEASSLNAMAGPGEIIVSKDVFQSTEKFVSAEPLPPRETTQRTESWESFRLLHIAERKDEG